MDQQQLFWQLIGFGTVAGLIPVYLGIAAALLAIKVLNRSWEGFLTGIATGILVYLFFDLMHEAVELTSAKDPTSWVIFLGSLLFGFVGLVAIEQRQQGRNRFEVPRLFLPYMIALGMGLQVRSGRRPGDWRQLRARGVGPQRRVDQRFCVGGARMVRRDLRSSVR